MFRRLRHCLPLSEDVGADCAKVESMGLLQARCLLTERPRGKALGIDNDIRAACCLQSDDATMPLMYDADEH